MVAWDQSAGHERPRCDNRWHVLPAGRARVWDVRHPEHAVAIRLADESYQRLVVEVEDVDAAISAVRNAIIRRT
jgi:hypothetical protein